MKNKSTVKEEIERLVNKYPWDDSKDLFRAELERLVLLAKGDQLKENIKSFIKVQKGKYEKE